MLHGHLAWTPVARLDSIHAWINDGLMALFFFVVGLEIKREVIAGELADPQRRRLPIIAALAGMVMPALVYLAIAGHDAALQRGWAIPAATDIAFAMAVLALVGRGLPKSVRLFLLTIAIVDDLGAIVVIGVFYTSEIHVSYFLISIVILAIMGGMNRFGVRSIPPYAIGAVLLWLAVLHSGAHATIAGVLAALTVPMTLNRHGDSALLRLEHALVWPSGFIVVPLFGLANAGVELRGSAMSGASLALPLGVAAGLFVGKQLGIVLAVLSCERLGIAPRPAGTSAVQIWGMALLCGIGFTMSLFISSLAFPTSPALVEEAKLGVLGGSLLSAIVGALVLRMAARSTPQ
jgi:NhaA family Na+:H+ antiporter